MNMKKNKLKIGVVEGELSFVEANATIIQGLKLKNQYFINAGVFLNS